MFMRNAFMLALGGIAVWLALGGESLACSCAPPPATAQEAMRAAPVLFWGRAVAVKESGGERTYDVETWAGTAVSPVTVPVKTRSHSAACGIELPLNQVELIAGSAKDGFVFATLCTKYWINTHRPAIVEILKTCEPFRPCPTP